MAEENGRAKGGREVTVRKGEKGGWEGREGWGGKEESKKSRVVPHPKLNRGCAIVTGTGGRVNGHSKNHENRRQQRCENRCAHVATIGALILTTPTRTRKRTTLVALGDPFPGLKI